MKKLLLLTKENRKFFYVVVIIIIIIIAYISIYNMSRKINENYEINILDEKQVYSKSLGKIVIDDGFDIPDKYNTGIKEGVSLVKVDKSDFVYNNIQFNYKETSDSIEFPYGGSFSINTNLLTKTTILENLDFSDIWQFTLGNENDMPVKRTVIINNCKFNSIRIGRREEVNIEYIFNNCEIGEFVGSRSTFNNCKLGGLAYDAINSFRECYFNNCYIGGLDPGGVYPWEGDLHLDGVQIFGYENIENNNISFKNCRIECLPLPRSESTVYINACIMISLDFNNARNILFEDCIINGGGYSIYLQNKNYEFDNVSLKNIRVGCSYKYGILYNNETNGAEYKNVSEVDSLYIGSCWNRENEINISITNYTNVERKLKVITENNEYEFIIPKSLLYSEMIEDITNYDDFPIDLVKTIKGDDSKWIKCYDVTDSEILIKTKVFY